ncbi:MAG TPA: SRPBCC family protein [Flavisolibacter sp.]|jgi:ligand-binding SRPBCC domain-containing protein
MPLIHLTTFIAAPPERVFDLSRSIDLHKASMSRFEEKPVDGVMNGLIGPGETVTWQAKHLFRQRRLKVKITAMERPRFFMDEQVEGDFRKMKHEHYFKPAENGTIMIDQFYFDVGRGLPGRLLTRVYLNRYFEKLLEERNALIRKAAEGSQWKVFLER